MPGDCDWGGLKPLKVSGGDTGGGVVSGFLGLALSVGSVIPNDAIVEFAGVEGGGL